MTPDDARRCAIAIADTWPKAGISVERWTEPLQRLDLDEARTTYRALRDHETHAPTIAAFLAKHRELHTRPVDRLREPCAICDGTGWEQVTVQRPNYPTPTTGVAPCRCTNGRLFDDAHRRAVEHNESISRQCGSGSTKPPAVASGGC